MSIAKVVEVIAEGDTIEGAVESALKEASRTIDSIQQIDIEHCYAKIENNKIKKYRIDAKISFIVHH